MTMMNLEDEQSIIRVRDNSQTQARVRYAHNETHKPHAGRSNCTTDLDKSIDTNDAPVCRGHCCALLICLKITFNDWRFYWNI